MQRLKPVPYPFYMEIINDAKRTHTCKHKGRGKEFQTISKKLNQYLSTYEFWWQNNITGSDDTKQPHFDAKKLTLINCWQKQKRRKSPNQSFPPLFLLLFHIYWNENLLRFSTVHIFKTTLCQSTLLYSKNE